MTRNRIWLVLLLVTGLLVTASTVVASTTKVIRGTARADTIRGTAAADTIYGLGGNDKIYAAAGNDKIYAGPGNDMVVAGPGTDTISCGEGTDLAVGDANDKADKSCEKTRGIPKSGGTTPPLPPPPPPAPACSNGKDDDGDGKVDYPTDLGCESASDTDETDPPPPAKHALPGTYCGFSEQGPGVCVTTSSDATIVAKFLTDSLMDCTAAGESFRIDLPVEVPDAGVPIRPDLSFSFSFNGTEPDFQGFTNIQESYFIKGVFTTDGKADGSFAFTAFSFDYQGVHFSCTQGAVGWHTTKQG